MRSSAEAYEAARNAVLVAAQATGFLFQLEEAKPAHTPGRVRLRLDFAIRGPEGKPVLPLPPGSSEPFVKIEQKIEVATGDIVKYTYDLIERSRGFHYGHHFHSEGGPPIPHVQGWNVPGGWQKEPKVIMGYDVLWDLVRIAYQWADTLASPESSPTSQAPTGRSGLGHSAV